MGAKIDNVDFLGEIPIHTAVDNKNQDICQYPVSKGARVDAINSFN